MVWSCVIILSTFSRADGSLIVHRSEFHEVDSLDEVLLLTISYGPGHQQQFGWTNTNHFVIQADFMHTGMVKRRVSYVPNLIAEFSTWEAQRLTCTFFICICTYIFDFSSAMMF